VAHNISVSVKICYNIFVSNFKPPRKANLIVKASDEIRRGLHANIVSVTSTSNQEVMFDFVNIHPNDKDEKGNQIGILVSRVTIPLNIAKELRLIMEAQMGKNIKE
jgi:hypothetical protein